MYDLKLATEILGPVAVVKAQGPIDVYTCPRFREYLLALIGSGEQLIAVDADDCDYLDSTGLGVLMGARKRVSEHGGRVDIICAEERVLNVFRVTGLAKVFRIHPGRDEAVTALAELAGAER